MRCRVKLELGMKTASWPLWVAFFSAGSVSTETDYPDIVSIFGTGPSQNYTSTGVTGCFGQFSKMEGVRSRGRPVWKHKSHFNRVFFSGTSHWICGDNYEKADGWIMSKDIIVEGVIPRTIWQRWDGENFLDDSTLIVEGLVTAKIPMHSLKFAGSALVTADKERAVVEVEDEAKLICKTVKPIAICTFIAPSGQIHDIISTTKVLKAFLLISIT